MLRITHIYCIELDRSVRSVQFGSRMCSQFLVLGHVTPKVDMKQGLTDYKWCIKLNYEFCQVTITKCLPTHSVWLAFITKPVGQEQLDRVGLRAVIRHKELTQFLLLQGLVTERTKSYIIQLYLIKKLITNQVVVSLPQ